MLKKHRANFHLTVYTKHRQTCAQSTTYCLHRLLKVRHLHLLANLLLLVLPHDGDVVELSLQPLHLPLDGVHGHYLVEGVILFLGSGEPGLHLGLHFRVQSSSWWMKCSVIRDALRYISLPLHLHSEPSVISIVIVM